jgi:ankyrin repeat protein
MEVTEAMIAQASFRGDVTLLLQWGREGVRVSSGDPLCQAVLHDKIGAVRILVKDLGADVNKADEDGFSPLYIAAQEGYLKLVRCLVAELGADVDRMGEGVRGGSTTLHMAAYLGKLEWCNAWSRNLEPTST